jgi:hypothetical protein
MYGKTKLSKLYSIYYFSDFSSNIWEPSKSASVKTASNEIQKTQFGQRQHTRNQNSQFQNSQNS